jgi:hypothetical protein
LGLVTDRAAVGLGGLCLLRARHGPPIVEHAGWEALGLILMKRGWEAPRRNGGTIAWGRGGEGSGITASERQRSSFNYRPAGLS